jgi:proline iminopeptidase
MTSIRANNITLEYETFGRSADPALVLIIGFGMQMTAWPDKFCQDLADQGFYVVRLDNRDTGLSQKFAAYGEPEMIRAFARLTAGEPFEAPYSEVDMADDVAGLLEALDIRQAHIAGMSMGGRIAQRLALGYPDRVASLVIMMSTSGAPGLPEGDPAVREILFSEPDDPDSRQSVIELGVRIQKAMRGSGFAFDEAGFVNRLERDLERCPDIDGYRRNLLGMRAAPPFHEQLAGISVPTLVLHGREDPVLPFAAGEDVAARIPGARLKIIEGWGHEVFSGDVHPILIEAISRHCLSSDHQTN